MELELEAKGGFPPTLQVKLYWGVEV